MANANISVLVGKSCAFLRITGRANFACSPDFKTVLNELASKGYKHFIVDLTECILMDSTFLGVLCGFGMKLNPKGAAEAGQGIELFNATARVAELLENLGAAHLFHMKSGAVNLPTDAQACAPESINPSHEQVTRTCLEAHQTLMAMNPENVARFKDVAQFLAEDLKNLEKSSG
jgi:anti-sigma B factor antagonist